MLSSVCVCVCDRSDGWCRDGDGRGGTVALHVAPPPAPCSLRRRPASQETTVSDATQSQHFLHSLQIKGVLVFSVDPLLLKGAFNLKEIFRLSCNLDV